MTVRKGPPPRQIPPPGLAAGRVLELELGSFFWHFLYFLFIVFFSLVVFQVLFIFFAKAGA